MMNNHLFGVLETFFQDIGSLFEVASVLWSTLRLDTYDSDFPAKVTVMMDFRESHSDSKLMSICEKS